MAHVYLIYPNLLIETWYIAFISQNYKDHTDLTTELALPKILLPIGCKTDFTVTCLLKVTFSKEKHKYLDLEFSFIELIANKEQF